MTTELALRPLTWQARLSRARTARTLLVETRNLLEEASDRGSQPADTLFDLAVSARTLLWRLEHELSVLESEPLP